MQIKTPGNIPLNYLDTSIEIVQSKLKCYSNSKVNELAVRKIWINFTNTLFWGGLLNDFPNYLVKKYQYVIFPSLASQNILWIIGLSRITMLILSMR